MKNLLIHFIFYIVALISVGISLLIFALLGLFEAGFWVQVGGFSFFYGIGLLLAKLAYYELNKLLETEQKKATKATRKVKPGYVYICSNEKLYPDGIFKVGMTTSTPYKRMKQITACFPFFVLCSIYCADPSDLEKTIHNHLESYRYRKEYFQLTEKELIRVVKEIVPDAEFLTFEQAYAEMEIELGGK